MSDISRDAWLNERIQHQRQGRTFLANEALRWGELIMPAANENPAKTDEGLRILAIASFPIGYLVLETIKAYERSHPGRINLVGLLVDDPLNQDARISAKKRIWHFYPEDERANIEFAIVESGLEFGVPVFTGDVKNDWFRAQLTSWNPAAVVCCGYGQLIDPPFLSVPPMGIYNFHPADLRAGQGAGPAPYDDAVARDIPTTRFTVHRMTEQIDAGPIVGVSPPINIRNEDGILPDPAIYYDKMLDGLDHLAFHLTGALVASAADGALRPTGPVDFETEFSAAKRADMMRPVDRNTSRNRLADPDPALF
ncbi:MAG: hypothetical protein GY798_11835 [Hyphomicrobiales bacterium]|nr:hypothetical protein [Hyphomicrobiales bacterium]